MKSVLPLLAVLLFGLLTVSHAGQPADVPPPSQYILFNRAPGQGMHQGRPETLGRRQFDEVLAVFPNRPGTPIQTADRDKMNRLEHSNTSTST